jgi:DNA invertase Pin-like site-specific DNA recombinase
MTKKPRRAAIYARVSTDQQTTTNQLKELRAVIKNMGWKLEHEYVDKGISGAKGREHRPALDQMCKAAVRREFDVVMAWSVDRLGRSLQHLVSFLNDIHAKGVDLYLHQQGVDTTTPGGKALYQMCGVFAEFERAMIQERVKAGLARARAEGKQLGRPFKHGRVDERLILKALSKGTGKKKIAKQLKIGVSVVQRVARHGTH